MDKGSIEILLEKNPEEKKALWGGKCWTDGYYVGTVGEHGTEKVITEYEKNQRRKKEEYKMIYEDNQLDLFESM